MEDSRESFLTMTDGTRLYVRDWLVEGSAQPCLVILHGLGEHCGRYLHVARFLNDLGISVRTYDHRGHGKSEGPRGDIPDAPTLLHDTEVVINDFAQQCQTQPLLFGHSLGGLFAARIATGGNIPLRGLILSSPALALRLTFIDRLLLRIVSAIAPHFAVSNGVKPQYVSHDPVVVSKYKSDPLVHNRISASLLNGMLTFIEYTQSRAPILTVPTLLLVAEDDHLVDPQGSHYFFDALPSNLGTAHFYSNFYHEVFNETDAAKVFRDLQIWLEARHIAK